MQDEMYNFLKKKKLLLEGQKGRRKKPWGAVCLLRNESRMLNKARVRKCNLDVGYLDCTKTCDNVLHAWSRRASGRSESMKIDKVSVKQ